MFCDASDCNNQGICIGEKGKFLCLCNFGSFGERCESYLDANLQPILANAPCELKDCSNNGICIGTKKSPTCLCNLGHSGDRCQYSSFSFNF